MNLVHDNWLQAVHMEGVALPIHPSSVANLDLSDLDAPRPDFQGAQYQFLIGLLQTAYAPADEDEWLKRWRTPPTTEELQAAFAPWADAFILNADGPAFMQDLQPTPEFRLRDIGELLIDQGSDINLYFGPASRQSGLCPACAATALFALQCNAPSGGVGHRVSMRGGGPLTTLIRPPEAPGRPAALWHKLWLNVMPKTAIRQRAGQQAGNERAAILPWLGPTRTSERKDGQTAPADGHPLQAYWGMPRRIRLDWTSTEAGRCSVCNAATDRLLRCFSTKNYGVNYLGWEHPLTPYYHDPKKKNCLCPSRDRRGIGYRHWLGLMLGNERQPEPAQVVRHYLAERWSALEHTGAPRLWVFGFDLDNAKARCWYDTTLPVHAVPPDRIDDFARAVRAMLEVAQEAAGLLRSHVKQAWFDRPKDHKDDPAVPQSFWQRTEGAFYAMLDDLQQQQALYGPSLAAVYSRWHAAVIEHTLRLFDQWAEGAYEQCADLKRVVDARADLEKWLRAAKPMKALRSEVQRHAKEAA